MLRTIMLLAAMVTTAAATAPEWLAAPMPAGFNTAFKATLPGQAIEERIPVGESVKQWTRMITLQRFGGGAALGGRGLLERMKTSIVTACPGATTSAIRESLDHGRQVADMRADCPRNPETGKPEVFFARMFTGAEDLYSVQYAFRSIPTDAEAATAWTYLASVRLCPGADPACASGTAR